jgi:hypothetical protein
MLYMLSTRIKSSLLRIIDVRPREDRAVLLTCLGIAFFFWLLLKMSQDYSVDKRVRLAFSIPEDKTFVVAPPEDIIVSLEGRGWNLLLNFFLGRTPQLVYDLTFDQRPEINRGQLRADLARLLTRREVNIKDFNYDRIDLRLEDKQVKTVPIALNSALSFAPEHHLKEPVKLTPDSVVVSGPASVVGVISSWPTETLTLDDLKGSVTKTLNLRSPLSAREIQLNVKQVTAEVQVERLTEKSFFVPLIVRSENQYDSLKLFPRQVWVTAVVGLSDFERLESQDFEFEIYLDASGKREGKNKLPISMTRKPAHAKSVTFAPQIAEFFIVEKKEEK